MQPSDLRDVLAAAGRYEKTGATSVAENHVLGMITGGLKFTVGGRPAGQLHHDTVSRVQYGDNKDQARAVAYWPEKEMTPIQVAEISLALRDYFTPKDIRVTLLPQPGMTFVLPETNQGDQDALRLAHLFQEMRNVRVDSHGEYFDLRANAEGESWLFDPKYTYTEGRNGTVIREEGPLPAGTVKRDPGTPLGTQPEG